MTGRIAGWNKSHRKTLHDPVDLRKVLTHLRWGCFVARVCQTLTRCSQPPHSSGTFFSAVSLLADVNYAENAAAVFLKALDRNTLGEKNKIKKTDATLNDKGLPLWIKECCNVMLILASWHSIRCARCNRHSFWQQFLCLCDGLMNFQKGNVLWMFDTSPIISNLKNRYPGLFAHFLSCAQTKSFSQLWFIFDVLSSLAAITEACQNRAKVILLMTLEMDHPDVCRRLSRKTE